MTVEADKPPLIIPKKRTGGKKGANAATHVDHIIMVQGGSSGMTSAKLQSLVEMSGFNSNVPPMKVNGFKSAMLNELPMIPDADEKSELSPINTDVELNNAKNQERPQNLPKTVNHFLSNSREIVDLSPIYENSSDAYSSHDDVRSDIIAPKSCPAPIEDDSNSLTPNSLSQTHSEVSLEMGLLTECAFSKNSNKRTKKRVNIVSEANIQSDDRTTEAILKYDSEFSGSPDKSVASNSGDGYLTMNGTIKRGKKKGQNVDVTLNMSREELEILEANIMANEISKSQSGFRCSYSSGIHIILWSFICMPVIAVVSGVYSFYMGTLTWYNIFVHVSEEKKLLVRIFASPFVILFYPFFILTFTLGLGLYAGVVQLTYSGKAWWKEVIDLEKGFYGWLCGVLHLSDCSPYEVVILTDLKVVEKTDMRGHSSTEDISI